MLELIFSLNPWVLASALNTILLALAFLAPKKLLTPAGLLHAWALGVILWGTLGWQGYVVVMFYFLVGSGVTRLGIAEKEAAGIAEKRSGVRGPENVWGSALTGTICALSVYIITLFFSDVKWLVPFFLLGYVASFSTKLSDTCASEVGKVYGKQTFLITTLQPVPKGTEGAVSLEGTLAGVVASFALALVGWSVGMINFTGIFFCMLAAFIATNLESIIGATLQNKFNFLTNEIVNFINTFIGAIVAILIAFAWNSWQLL
ncbi:MAG: TIGR00297 family protein [Oscillatoriaceae bacterium SKW80]|nr:TIGR00297 family protein [Oscillatoriaceae bacterium SKYG93]MCX8120170.1 TIGR00297 family protein [Oscillatoriaceae bacterium SKW80]MDW8453096.1 TIGR00297 family protein [Oscillatoriaceae cyanobacterium SKYGB_i_bin93]HIK28993.1 TIGR00297 family protein [Oscillatoriaceae cyanobacterium M7585_C2015_266]